MMRGCGVIYDEYAESEDARRRIASGGRGLLDGKSSLAESCSSFFFFSLRRAREGSGCDRGRARGERGNNED